ncbi:MAG TPA: PAS domain S-box protein [Syntrophorhabdaceae bacterium]|nr:PAS domain S-box protein [Syntrophorhabdaceae bacterium]
MFDEAAMKEKQSHDEFLGIEDKLRVIIDAAPIAVMIHQDDYWIYANRASEEITGHSVRELLGTHFWEIAHPDHLQFVREYGQKRQHGEETKNRYEFKIVTKSGIEKWVDLTGTSTLIGAKPAAVVSMADVTERKMAEKAHLEDVAKYRALFENANDAIILLKDGRIIDCNKKTLEMFQCTMGQIIGETQYGFSPLLQSVGVSSKERISDLIRAAQSGESQFFEWRHCRYDRSVFDTEVSLSRIAFSSETLIQAIIRDVTERKLHEKKQRQLVSELQEALAKVKILSGFLPICASCKKNTRR